MESEFAVACDREGTPLRRALERGFLGRCPCCGTTPLFARYLKQVACCPACGADFGRIRTDDAAPWLTILVVGHIFLPLLFFINLEKFMPFWASMIVWEALFVLITVTLLPRCKGFFIAVLWRTRAPGVEG